VFLPNKNIQAGLLLLDSTESAGEDPFAGDSTGGLTLAGEVGIKHTLGGRGGKQTFGFLYGFDRDYTEVGLDRNALLGNLIGTAPVKTRNDSWALFYNAHQYLQEWGKGRGWGLFARFGISDGEANLIDWNTALGIGGTGLFDSRPKDTFGLGYYRVNRVKGALTELLDLGNEQGLEAFYNMALTPWFQLTADLQYLDTAYGQPGSSLRLRPIPGGLGLIPSRTNVAQSDNAWVFGLRARVEF